MFWLLKNVIYLVIFIFLIFMVSQLEYKGKPVKEYAKEFYKRPLVQSVVERARTTVENVLHKDLSGYAEPQEDLTPEERKELDDLLKKSEEDDNE